jgi:hypothetical protein
MAATLKRISFYATPEDAALLESLIERRGRSGSKGARLRELVLLGLAAEGAGLAAREVDGQLSLMAPVGTSLPLPARAAPSPAPAPSLAQPSPPPPAGGAPRPRRSRSPEPGLGACAAAGSLEPAHDAAPPARSTALQAPGSRAVSGGQEPANTDVGPSEAGTYPQRGDQQDLLLQGLVDF